MFCLTFHFLQSKTQNLATLTWSFLTAVNRGRNRITESRKVNWARNRFCQPQTQKQTAEETVDMQQPEKVSRQTVSEHSVGHFRCLSRHSLKDFSKRRGFRLFSSSFFVGENCLARKKWFFSAFFTKASFFLFVVWKTAVSNVYVNKMRGCSFLTSQHSI